MSLNVVYDILEKERKKDTEIDIENLQLLSKKLTQKLNEFKDSFEDECALETSIHDLLLLAEQIYYKSTHLNWMIEKDPTKNAEDVNVAQMIAQQTKHQYSITGSAEEGFNLILPFVPKRFNHRKTVSAKIIGQTLRTIIDNYLKEHKINTPVYDKAHAIFTIIIGNDISFAATPDGDNLDLKHVIDAFNSSIIENDTLLCLSYTINGVLSKGEDSHIEIFIKGV